VVQRIPVPRPADRAPTKCSLLTSRFQAALTCDYCSEEHVALALLIITNLWCYNGVSPRVDDGFQSSYAEFWHKNRSFFLVDLIYIATVCDVMGLMSEPS
jgi:hypothetical protein